MYQLGILANVEFIDYTDTFRYARAEDAYRILTSHIPMETPEQENRMMQFITRNMEQNQGFKLDLHCKWALLRWSK